MACIIVGATLGCFCYFVCLHKLNTHIGNKYIYIYIIYLFILLKKIIIHYISSVCSSCHKHADIHHCRITHNRPWKSVLLDSTTIPCGKGKNKDKPTLTHTHMLALCLLHTHIISLLMLFIYLTFTELTTFSVNWFSARHHYNPTGMCIDAENIHAKCMLQKPLHASNL